jgi:hypothetical protein
MRRTLCSLLLLGASAAVPVLAQTARPSSREVDVAVSYNAEHRDQNNGGSFWEQGGSAEAAASFFHGFGAAVAVSGGHASNIGGTGVNLTTVTTTAGPRYTFRRSRFAAFAEGTLGASFARDTVFPANGGAVSSANSFAAEAGGGVDVRVSRRFAVRAFQASWLRTQFPNATTNVQNTLQLGAGIVLRLQR